MRRLSELVTLAVVLTYLRTAAATTPTAPAVDRIRATSASAARTSPTAAANASRETPPPPPRRVPTSTVVPVEPSSCGGGVARYSLEFHAQWSKEKFPKLYPTWRPPAQWSTLIGRSHNARSTRLWREGELCPPELRAFVEDGDAGDIMNATRQTRDSGVLDSFTAPAFRGGVGISRTGFFTDTYHHQVSVAVHIIPSPDWFVGIDSLDLCLNDHWIDETVVDLYPMDGGTQRGLTYTAPKWSQKPPKPISQITAQKPRHLSSPFHDRRNPRKELAPFGHLLIRKEGEYLSADGEPRRGDRLVHREERGGQGSARSSPVAGAGGQGSARSPPGGEQVTAAGSPPGAGGGQQVTAAAGSLFLRDEAVAAVMSVTEPGIHDRLVTTTGPAAAVGQAAARGKHHRHHHEERGGGSAKDAHRHPGAHAAPGGSLHPNDAAGAAHSGCRVSEWSEWTPCTKTCGFGSKSRARRVVSAGDPGGEPCPDTMEETEFCGGMSNCGFQHFKWVN